MEYDGDGECEKLQKIDGNDNKKAFIYVFDVEKAKSGGEKISTFRKNIWQIFPAVCASLICFPYGLMLGWPSPTYPRLIDSQPATPHHFFTITEDQSAMVAGFLMIGNTLSTPLSSTRKIPSKYGLVLSATLTVFGWMVMWQSSNLFYLLASRLLVGLGHGFGLGQLKYYIGEISNPKLASILLKCINLHTVLGVICAFSLGPFVDFRQFSITSIIFSVFVWFLTVFLPSTPRELVQSDKTNEARKLVQFLAPHLDPNEEIEKVKVSLGDKRAAELSFLAILRDSSLRTKFYVLFLSVFFQQFSGMPATIVYSQILFEKLLCPNAHLCAIFYISVYFLTTIYATFCLDKQSKKHLLLFSAIGVSYMLTVEILVIKENAAKSCFQYISLVVLCAFLLCHTVGLGSVPTARLVSDLFPKEARTRMTHFAFMLNSMLALVITKTFQVLVFRLDTVVPFYLFLVVSNVAIMFFTIFIRNDEKINDQ